MQANIAVVSCQGLLPMFYGQRVHKSRGLKQLKEDFVWICGLWIDEFLQAVGTTASGRASRQLHGMANCTKVALALIRTSADHNYHN